MFRNSHDIVKLLVKEYLNNPKRIVDMTLGNGHDSFWLKEAFPEAELIGFDIQKNALENSEKRLEEFDKITLIHDGHENILNYIKKEIDFGIYNLGFLPGGDKTITTEKDTVLSSLQDLLSILKIGGFILITCYPGHPEGKEEANMLENFLKEQDQKDFTIVKYNFLNQKNDPPFVLSIEKLRETK